MSTTTPDAGASADADADTAGSANSKPSTSPSSSSSFSSSSPAETLPPLSGREFREYNRLAEHMDAFHNHFRSTWNLLHGSASSGRRAQGLSIRAFIATGLDFVSHLETHHAIEERYVFPDLARRMPEFRTGRERNGDNNNNNNHNHNNNHNDHSSTDTDTDTDTDTNTDTNTNTDEDVGTDAGGFRGRGDSKKRTQAAELLRQHVEIHKGMEGLREYLRKCLSGETELQMSVLKAQLDTWGTVLWAHLDQEVRTLGAENMRRYWSLDEMRKMRM